MGKDSYPALYQAADEASVSAQRAYLLCIKGYGGLAVVGAGLAAYGIDSRPSAVIAAFLFMAGLGISILMTLKQYETVWYRARAVAESIKTATWRFMLRAEPFNGLPLPEAKVRLQEILGKVLQEHKNLGGALSGAADKSQFTERMVELRESSLQQRLAVYLDERVREQRRWYASRSKLNVIYGRRWFWGLISAQTIAIALTIVRAGWPEWKYWPTEIFVVTAASILGWIQLKRYRELGAAYAIAAHEIGLAEAQVDKVESEEALSEFVSSTEAAFSREHTQWVARGG